MESDGQQKSNIQEYRIGYRARAYVVLTVNPPTPFGRTIIRKDSPFTIRSS